MIGLSEFSGGVTDGKAGPKAAGLGKVVGKRPPASEFISVKTVTSHELSAVCATTALLYQTCFLIIHHVSGTTIVL